MLPHLPFFEVLATAPDESSLVWRTYAAGLAVLRLADRWMDDGITREDHAWGVANARALVLAMDEGDPARRILLGIVDAMPKARRGRPAAVAPRLIAYARALDLRGDWKLAADVYASIGGRLSPITDHDLLVDALMQCGYCHRRLGDLDAAAEQYRQASEVAAQHGDIVKVLRAQVLDAKLHMARGNFPAAERILDETIVEARRRSFTQVMAMALHDRASVAHSRGEHERAVRFAYDALEHTTDPLTRDRVLSDIAAILVELGVRSVARDALLVLSATAQDQYTRWISSINLMELEAMEGREPQFEQLRRRLQEVELPPFLSVAFRLAVGDGLRYLGRPDDAGVALRDAADVAERLSIHELSFKADRALEDLRAGQERVRPMPAGAPAPGLADVAAGISGLRLAAGLA